LIWWNRIPDDFRIAAVANPCASVYWRVVMKNFVVRWLEFAATFFFGLIVVFSGVWGMGLLGSTTVGAVMGGLLGLVLGVVAATFSTGIVFLLLSINQHLARSNESRNGA
jgi:hypothetical protein